MEKLSFDTGIKEYEINGKSILKINFSDKNLYYRFISIKSDIEEIEKEYIEKTKGYDGKLDMKGFPTKDNGEINTEILTEEQEDIVMNRASKALEIMHDIDSKVKEKLQEIFMLDNDFDAIFEGVNIMATDAQGNRILSNFLNMITPLMQKALKVADDNIDTLVGNREARRARNRNV